MKLISVRSPLFKNVTLLTIFVIAFAVFGVAAFLHLSHIYLESLLLPFYVDCIIDGILACIVIIPVLRYSTIINKTIEQATFDPLTGLYNRSSFSDHINSLIKKKKTFLLLLVDLCKFKEVNDTYGHEVGDEVLKITGKRLVESVGADDMVVRLGGDEFVILLHGAGIDSHEKVIQQIIEEVKLPIEIGGQILHTSLNIGKARYPEAGDSVRILMSKADCAMYIAKKNGVDVYECQPTLGCHNCRLRVM